MTIEQRLLIIRAAKAPLLALADDSGTNLLTEEILHSTDRLLEIIIEDLERERDHESSNHQTPPSQ